MIFFLFYFPIISLMKKNIIFSICYSSKPVLLTYLDFSGHFSLSCSINSLCLFKNAWLQRRNKIKALINSEDSRGLNRELFSALNWSIKLASATIGTHKVLAIETLKFVLRKVLLVSVLLLFGGLDIPLSCVP